MVRLINPPSLSGLERKLLRLIQFYQTTPKGQLPDSLEVCRLVEYVQTVDFSLRKMKKPLLEKNIANLLVKCTEVSPILVEKETADTEMVPVEGSILEVEAQPIQQEEEHIVPVEDISQNSNVPNNEVALPNVQSQSYNKQNTNAKRRQREYACDERENKRHKSATVDSKYPVPTTRLSDLGGVEVCIEEILELIAMPLTHPEVYLHTGVQPPRGILLHGPPGCGKTLLANAIAGELGVPFLSISAPSVVSGMSGESEKKIREIFQEASEMAPCLMFIDEIDAITPKRETAQREMERRIVAQLLTSMDDLSWEKNNYKPVLIIGATNRPDSLDSALRRAGRFDREIALSVPGEEAREKILQVLSKKLRLSGNFDFKALAKQTAGYVGADLNALTCAAGMIAVRRIFESIRKEPVSIKGNESSEVSTIDEEVFENIKRTVESLDSIESSDPKMKSTLKELHSISAFLASHPNPLTQEELEPLFISMEDFKEALTKVQPSSKREGFATVPDVSWDDIGALQSVRDELRMAVVEPIKHPEFFRKVGIQAPAGVLLWGPPGCGKTLLAKAVAHESHANFISVKGPELLNKYVGESERAVRQVFARARASSPCVVFFDELDALCARRDDSQSEASARVVNTLLTEMDGVESRKQVFIIAATNRPDIIDPAILRPGRLDKLLYVDLPTTEERYEILKTLSKKTPLHPNVSLNSIACHPKCVGLSGADLASLLREAAVATLRDSFYASGTLNPIESANDVKVTASHFDIAFSKVSPSVSAKDKKQYDSLRKRFGSNGLASASK